MRLHCMSLSNARMIENVRETRDGFHIVIDRAANETVVRRISPDGSNLGVYRSPKPEDAINAYKDIAPGITRVYLAGFDENEATELLISLQSEHGIELTEPPDVI